jgi:class 3 adenylate cyclase
VVQQYGGTLHYFTGQGFQALFSMPLAQEDHAVRALRAAGALQRWQPDSPLCPCPGDAGTVGLGLHTGYMVECQIGDSRYMTYLGVGDTLEVAMPLAQEATPGTIVLSAATAQRVRGIVSGDVVVAGGAPLCAIPLPMYTGRQIAPMRDGRQPVTAAMAATCSLEAGGGHSTHLAGAGAARPWPCRWHIGSPGMGKTQMGNEFRCRRTDNR